MSKTRKTNGEGTVFQVSENKWVGKIRLGKDNFGTPKVKQFSGKTEAIVKKKIKDYIKSEEFDNNSLPCFDSLSAYFDTWLKEYQYNKLKPQSFDRLECTAVNNIYPYLGHLKFNQITTDQVQKLINHLYKNEKLSYSSVKKAYVALNSCYKHAMIKKDVSINPCFGVELPSAAENTKEIVSFTQDEVERLKTELTKRQDDGTYSYYYGAAFMLILNTGLRMGEALSLSWSDVDLDNKIITIRKNGITAKKRDIDGNIIGGYDHRVQNSTKTSKSNRTIPINKSAEIALRQLREGNKSSYVIVNSKSKRVLPANFERSFRVILRNAGIDKSGIHTLRHTFATMLYQRGVEVKMISRLLGHSSVKITYDIYVHLFEEDINSVTSVLDQ